jgi:N-acetylneuraminic acid mutarotase
MLAAGLVAPFVRVGGSSPLSPIGAQPAAAQPAPPPMLPVAVFHANVAAAGGWIYVIGGRGGAGRGLISPFQVHAFQVYEAASNIWTKRDPELRLEEVVGGAQSMVSFRQRVVAGADRRLYLFTTTDTRIYDPASGVFTTGAPPTEQRESIRASIELDGRLLIVSEHTVGFLPVWRIEEYDPAGDAWVTRSTLDGEQFDSFNGATRGLEQTLLVMIRRRSGVTLASYDLAQDSWTPRAPVPTERTRSAVIFSGGKLNVIGGDRSNWDVVGLNEVYDPASDQWASKARMPTARVDASAVALPDGSVYVIGGIVRGTGEPENDTFTTAAVERYDPATDTWLSSGVERPPRG